MGLRPGVPHPPRPAVLHALKRLHERASGPPPFLQGRPLHRLELALPHEVFDLPLDAVAAGRGLEAARATGVSHLVMDGPNAIAAAETPHAAPDAASVHAGPFAAGMADAVRAAEALPEVRQGSFEVRLLRCAALHLLALWLHEAPGGRELLLPLAPAPPGLTPNAPYGVADLLRVVQPLAAQRLAFQNHP